MLGRALSPNHVHGGPIANSKSEVCLLDATRCKNSILQGSRPSPHPGCPFLHWGVISRSGAHIVKMIVLACPCDPHNMNERLTSECGVLHEKAILQAGLNVTVRLSFRLHFTASPGWLSKRRPCDTDIELFLWLSCTFL